MVNVFDYNLAVAQVGQTCSTASLSYSYDLAGNLTQLTYPDSSAVTYVYDDANQLTSVTDAANRTTTYTYDAAGRQTGIAYPNGVQAAYTYDTAGRLLSLVHTHPVHGVIASAAYTVDGVGNRLTMVDLEGTTSYACDNLYRLTQVTYPDGETVSYTYDPMGNRTTMTSSVHGATTYSYDDGDRLLSLTDASGTTLFTWDENGNMVSKGSAVYTFDGLDRLAEVISGTVTVQFAYNGDGVRLGKTVNGTSTAYVQDIAAPLPMVVAEITAGGTNRYIYGNDLLALHDPLGDVSFYHTDGLGSTRALSDLAGQRTDAYGYDVFGAVRTRSGNAGQPFTFTGEQLDDELGLVFLRARYYDPLTGRFISSDHFPGFLMDGQSTNSYVYTQNNPVIYTDPNGELIITALAVGALAYGAYQVYDAWSDFLYNAEVTRENRRGYYEFDFTNPDWQARYANYDPAQDIIITARSGAYAGLTVPGTSVTGPPPTSLDWTIPADFTLREFLLPGFKKPVNNRVTPVTAGQALVDNSRYSSSSNQGGTLSTRYISGNNTTTSSIGWGGPPSQAK